MKVIDYVKASISENGFSFSVINKSEKLDYYLSSTEFDRTSYEFKNDRIFLIYEAKLSQETKERINKAFQRHISGNDI